MIGNLQFLNENQIECDRKAFLKPWQHRKSTFFRQLVFLVTLQKCLVSDLLPLISDINGPNGKKMKDFAHSNFRNLFVQLNANYKPQSFGEVFKGCNFSIGNDSNLRHKKEMYYVEYKFDVEVRISCDKASDKGHKHGKLSTMKCTLEVKDQLFRFGFEINNYDPYCINFP